MASSIPTNDLYATLEPPKWPLFDGNDSKALQDVLVSKAWWSGTAYAPEGHHVFDFNEEFKRFHQSKHAFGCSNGTVAVEIALRALDIGLGDEVIVTDSTFVASGSAIVAVNAVPILCDIDPNTFNMDLTTIEQLITDRTKALVVVHLGGIPVDMEKIMEIAQRNHLKVIEDCAQAHHAKFQGKLVGNWGDIGTFSFNATKTLTGGEGGALITNNDELAGKIYSLLDNGRRLEDPTDGQTFGSDLRLSQFTASLLLSQMKKFPAQHMIRNQNGIYLNNLLSRVDGITCQTRIDGVEEAGYYTFLLKIDPRKFGGPDSRNKLIEFLNKKNIHAIKVPPALHQLQMFKEWHLLKGIDYSNGNWGGEKSNDKFFPNSSDFAQNAIEIPHYYLLGSQDLLSNLKEVITSFRQSTLQDVKPI